MSCYTVLTAEPLITDADMIAAWAGPVGRTWVKLNGLLDRQLEPIGLATTAGAAPAP